MGMSVSHESFIIATAVHTFIYRLYCKHFSFLSQLACLATFENEDKAYYIMGSEN